MAAAQDVSIRENDLNGALRGFIKLSKQLKGSTNAYCILCREHLRSCKRLPKPLQDVYVCDSCSSDLPEILSEFLEIDTKPAFAALKKREKEREREKEENSQMNICEKEKKILKL